jgi:hypothetical protein
MDFVEIIIKPMEKFSAKLQKLLFVHQINLMLLNTEIFLEKEIILLLWKVNNKFLKQPAPICKEDTLLNYSLIPKALKSLQELILSN